MGQRSNGPALFAFCGDAAYEPLEDLVCQTNEEVTRLYYTIDDADIAARVRSAIRMGATWWFYMALQKGSAYASFSNPYPNDINDVTYTSVGPSETAEEILVHENMVYGYLTPSSLCEISDGDTIFLRALDIAYQLPWSNQADLLVKDVGAFDFKNHLAIAVGHHAFGCGAHILKAVCALFDLR